MSHFFVQALVIGGLTLPLWRFYRPHRGVETFSAWLTHTELHLLNSLGGQLWAASWLTQPLFL